MVLDGSFQAVTKEPAQQVNANPQMGFHLREYTSADYTQEITKYPVQVSINKEIFLEVTLADETSRNTTLGVKVNECRATPSPDPHDSTSYQLIRDRLVNLLVSCWDRSDLEGCQKSESLPTPPPLFFFLNSLVKMLRFKDCYPMSCD
uniref:ZP domain-containing protein n=1 Tax=Biomphalaria glabrata TaxID=6526 RepID=A0A2C9LF63_BIOGL